MREHARRWMVAVALLAGMTTAARAQVGEFKYHWGLHASYPEYASASFSIGTESEAFDGSRGGFALMLEPGLNGGRALIGRTAGLGDGAWTSAFGILQTWGTPPTTRPGVTYFSAEQRLTMNWLTVGIGTAFRVGGGNVSTAFGSLPQSGVASFLLTGVLGVHLAF